MYAGFGEKLVCRNCEKLRGIDTGVELELLMPGHSLAFEQV